MRKKMFGQLHLTIGTRKTVDLFIKNSYRTHFTTKSATSTIINLDYSCNSIFIKCIFHTPYTCTPKL